MGCKQKRYWVEKRTLDRERRVRCSIVCAKFTGGYWKGRKQLFGTNRLRPAVRKRIDTPPLPGAKIGKNGIILPNGTIEKVPEPPSFPVPTEGPKRGRTAYSPVYQPNPDAARKQLLSKIEWRLRELVEATKNSQQDQLVAKLVDEVLE